MYDFSEPEEYTLDLDEVEEMTKEQIVDLIKERYRLNCDDAEHYHDNMVEACNKHDVDRAAKYSKWELQSYLIMNELDLILTMIDKSDFEDCSNSKKGQNE